MASRVSPDTIMYSPIENNDSNLKQVRFELLTKIDEVAKEVYAVRDKNNERIIKVKEVLDYLKKEVIKLKECCDTKDSLSAAKANESIRDMLKRYLHMFNAAEPQLKVSSSAATSGVPTSQLFEEIENTPEGKAMKEELQEHKKKQNEQAMDLKKKVKTVTPKKGGKNKKKQTRKRRKTKRRVTKQ